MATVIERPVRVAEDRTVYVGSDNSAGWAVALLVLVVLALIALFAWPGLARRMAPAATPSTIQVNVPQATPAAQQTPTQSTLPVDNGPSEPVMP